MEGSSTIDRPSPAPATDESVPPPADVASPPGAGALPLAVVVWAVGALGVVLRLAGQGPLGFRAGLVVAALAAVVVVVLHLPGASPAARAGAVAAIAAVGCFLTWGTVGRVPLPLALLGVVVADRAAFGPLARPDRTARDPAVASLLVLAAGAGAWWALGSNPVAAVTVVAALGLVLAHDRTGLGPRDRRAADAVATATARIVGMGRRGAGEVGVGASALGSAGGRVVARAARATGRVLASWGRAVTAPRNRPIVGASLVSALVTAPIFHRAITEFGVLIRGTNDIPGTIERVRWMEWWPLRMPVPHPGWTVAVKVTMPVIGEVAAVTLILAVATGASTAVLMTIARGRWDRRPPLSWPLATAFGLGYVLMESPAVLAPRSEGLWSRYLEAGTHARGQGYAPLHQWGTPTITLSMPFVFALFALLLLVMIEVEEGSPKLARHRWYLAVLTVVTTLVQPATTLAVAPAVPIYLLVSRRLTRPMAAAVGPFFVLPGALVCLGQTWFLAAAVSPWEQATWIWRPFWSLSYFGLDRPAYWASALLFAICLWAGGRRYVADPAVGLSFVAFCVGMVPFTLWEMTGVFDVPDGDLGVPALMAFILWFLSSLRFALGELQAAWTARSGGIPMWTVAFGALVALMVAAGIYDLASSGGFVTELR